jgi:AraC-like DNA-binding protein
MSTLDIINTVLITQGFFISFIFLRMKGEDWSNRFLFALFFIGSFNMATNALKASGWFVHAPFLMDINLLSIVLLELLQYLYARRLTGKPPLSFAEKFAFSAWMLIIFLYYLPYSWWFKGYDQLYFIAAYQSTDLVYRGHYFLFNLLFTVFSLIYLFKSIRMLRQYLKDAQHYFSNEIRFHAEWVWQMFALKLGLIGLGYSLGWIFMLDFTFRLSVIFYFVPIYAFVLWKNFTKPIETPPIHIQPIFGSSDGLQFSSDSTNIEEDIIVLQPSFQEPTPIDRTEILETVQAFMAEKKPYLDQDLNIKKLGDLLGIKAYIVSQAINQGTGKNFFEFVNQYRVEEAKTQLVDAQKAHFSIEGIATSCGFSSRTTFYSTFKKIVGITPTQFRQAQIQTQIQAQAQS